ncbi:hypothetical protein FLONG3_11216 [Fusarium longipes]|uniref:Heterokaryon incompatibility domain-containing protein n=1 Tax=Fusarium longipes TaxID=694270 RepID=A0A395RHJ5_9HYPO|nr:hypothetical protein FLONG3_11216 [Fusarium longipes]
MSELDILMRCAVSASEAGLCAKCVTISWDRTEFRFSESKEEPLLPIRHHETFGELVASCEAGCPLCQTFYLLLSYRMIKGLRDSHSLQWELGHNHGSWALGCEVSDPSFSRAGWELVSSSWTPPTQAITTVKGLKPADLDNDLKDLLNESIDPCMPTRVIDVASDDESMIRLINTADLSDKGKKSPYVILSYCWGASNGPARTTSRNIEDRQIKLELHDLPRTIRDAIRITRLMKVQYLWVDAVCIIQSSQDANAQQEDEAAMVDWERESMRMASYYSKSFCCIAASGAKDSSEGILLERQAVKYGYKKWLSPSGVYCPSPYSIRDNCKSLLLGRGWCLQEWILSPRMLHWTANGLIWECQQGFFWEGQKGYQGEAPEVFCEDDYDAEQVSEAESWSISQYSGGISRHTHDYLLEFGEENGQQFYNILHMEEEKALGKCWFVLIKQYYLMGLSVHSDRLAAVQGIASHLSKRHNVPYFAGIFRSRCAEHLMWEACNPTSTLGRNENFPTWSWASSRDTIIFTFDNGYDDDEGEVCSCLMEDLEPFPPQTEKSVTFIANRQLRFRSPLLRLSLLDPEQIPPSKDQYSWESRPYPELCRFMLGSVSPDFEGLICAIRVDDVASSPQLKDCAHLLVLWIVPGEVEEFRGLVVQIVEEKHREGNPPAKEEMYRRVGTFRPGEAGGGQLDSLLLE